MILRPRNLLTASFLLACAVIAACANDDIDMGDVKTDIDSGAMQLGPAPVPDGGDAAPDAAEPIFQCESTVCPAPWATCLPASGPTYACGTDLSRDANNCGTCGSACPVYPPLHMTSRCIEGGCALECFNETMSFGKTDWRNCNAKVDDGCEVDVWSDAQNCGTCGNACAAGQRCIEGQCGCPPGKTDCDGICVDLQSDNGNCGTCGNYCFDPPDACPGAYTKNAQYACSKGTCGHLGCSGNAADCNGDITKFAKPACGGDGCEVADLTTDKDNCGACGNKCTGPGEECVDEGSGPKCAVPCASTNTTLCGGECEDLLNDPQNCGACGAGCAQAGPHQSTTCSKGLCGFECEAGYADCNGTPADGCEVDLRIHPANCGACGNACDIAGGQPCIEGKCLTAACDGGVTR